MNAKQLQAMMLREEKLKFCIFNGSTRPFESAGVKQWLPAICEAVSTMVGVCSWCMQLSNMTALSCFAVPLSVSVGYPPTGDSSP